jgi:transposase
MDFVVWTSPKPIVLQIKAYSRRIAALTKLKVKAKNQLHALQATIHTPRQVIEDGVVTIKQLERQIEKLSAGALKLIHSDEEINNVMNLLISVKGIAEKTAIQLIGELLVLPEDMKPKQWVAYAGLDPRIVESGKSVSKKRRISKAGNRYLRAALYMPSLSASRHEVHINAYYQHLINDNGLTKLQAICAVMRKLLHAIHGMLKSGKSFDGTRFYAIPAKG